MFVKELYQPKRRWGLCQFGFCSECSPCESCSLYIETVGLITWLKISHYIGLCKVRINAYQFYAYIQHTLLYIARLKKERIYAAFIDQASTYPAVNSANNYFTQLRQILRLTCYNLGEIFGSTYDYEQHFNKLQGTFDYGLLCNKYHCSHHNQTQCNLGIAYNR